MIHRLFTTCSCICTSRQVPVYPNCSKSVLRNGARRTCRNSGTNGGGGTAACGYNTGALIPTLPPSSSSAFGVNSLPTVLRPASCQSIVRLAAIRLIVRAFTTPLAVPRSTVFDPSIGPKYLPCSNRESRGPRQRLDGCKGIHHTRSPNCAKGEQHAFPHFVHTLSCRLDPPQTDGACWLHTAQDTSTDRGLLVLRRS